MTLSYLGALKSQVLIPSFAIFGATLKALRMTTLAWAFIGVLLAMLWVRMVFGVEYALLAGAFMALDPSFLFASRHDWGPVALAMLLRCAGLYLITNGWARRSTWRFLGAGFCFGLGVYNKIDLAVFLAAAALALSVANHRLVVELFRSRLSSAIALVLGFGVGAAGILANLGSLLGATATRMERSIGSASEQAEKLNTFKTMLDGSYFHRLMLSGGNFTEVAGIEGAASGAFLLLVVVATSVLTLSVLQRARSGKPDRATIFALLTMLLTLLGIYFVPRATRLHHALHVYPFPQLVVAIFVVRLWSADRMAGWRRPLFRAAALGVTAAVIIGSMQVNIKTMATIRETGGKGLWSDSLMRFATELEAQPQTVVVSLDWGFDKPLRFVSPDLKLEEPIWRLREHKRKKKTFEGSPDTVYLIHPPGSSLFSFGNRFLKAVRDLPGQHVSLRHHTDRAGDPTFISIRLNRPHQITYRNDLKVRLD
jgi:4-amino-4-deoxy-L-arabinose transferase-like glycosyltransferase